ncbi:Uncharacterised protein [Leminorella richardii]|uniref:Uncharacterized protein n=1 Tax=Leminorella richardii TaxID=158841 RepID=A0A2X4Y001_9GAMM|nr:hypothetical protein [Leminorella richardii]SQI42114.1 Uncharacterised protein [Leminorella richardii]
MSIVVIVTMSREDLRLYQVLQECNDKNINKAVFNILKGNDSVISDSIWDVLKNFDYLKDNNKMGKFY